MSKPSMNGRRLWLRVVGAFYVLQFVMMAIVRAPISALGPAGALARAAAGDPLARFLVDTWVTFGLEVLGIGLAVLYASRRAEQARSVVITIIAIEIFRGLVADVYILTRGAELLVPLVWIAIHSLVIVTGLLGSAGAATRIESTA